MKYYLSGVNTINKGAELMLYAILQAIETHDKDAVIFTARDGTVLSRVDTSLQLRFPPQGKLSKFMQRHRIDNLLRKLNVPIYAFDKNNPSTHIDYFFDANGFWVTDQWNITQSSVEAVKRQIKRYHKRGTRIVYLPQAFGPLEKETTQQMVRNIYKYADLVFPRDAVSMNYLEQAPGYEASKTQLAHDFTSLVAGKFPEQYEHLKGGVCIIPNMRMIDRGGSTRASYISLLTQTVETCKALGYTPYFLNHEGPKDKHLITQLQKQLPEQIDAVLSLNALEIKGLIATAHLCISSRYHGVVSALNSGVPCLCTSWSHKYAELYKDYELQCLTIDENNEEASIATIREFLDNKRNNQEREHLQQVLPKIKAQTTSMWDMIWALK